MFIPLELRVRPSRIDRGMLALAGGLAMAGVALAALTVWIKAGLACIVVTATLHRWQGQSRVAAGLRLGRNGQVQLRLQEWQDATIVGQPVVLSWLITLRLALTEGRTVRLVLWPDSADADALRRLRAWLRWGYRPLPPDGIGTTRRR